ncbi:hypothetical protein VKT23_019970 [Stygiomarasmius scandens]|uniref:Uncharacterized protein n=1 Tax=Marasmiellus scandens TaxID=2682957 RepID=A0ABR1IK19_9AGAR
MADLTALGMYATIANCGGNEVADEGRSGGCNGGWTIGLGEYLSSCCIFHIYLGGIHGNDFPQITGPGRQNDTNFLLFDSTGTNFDNKVVTEYLAGNTSNLLVVGPEETNSDKRVFLTDQNATINALASQQTFASMCASVFKRMMETVPYSVTLSNPIEPYPIKPTTPKLTLTPGGNVTFDGSIRVRITDGDTSNLDSMVLTMPYTDRDGNSRDSCTIQTTPARIQGGFGGGFRESFKFFEFSASPPASSSISNFKVNIQQPDSDLEVHDNNGVGFPLDDRIIPLEDQSCINGDSDSSNWNMTIVAAVRDELADKPLALEVTVKTPRQGVIVPVLVKQTVQMEQWTAAAKTAGYTLFKGTYDIPIDSLSTSFNVVSGEGEGEVRKDFTKTGKPWA